MFDKHESTKERALAHLDGLLYLLHASLHRAGQRGRLGQGHDGQRGQGALSELSA